jgi:hypothetical protein
MQRQLPIWLSLKLMALGLNLPSRDADKGRMRKLFLQLHIHLTLICSSYFLIFGISSLNFNHHFKFAEPSKEVSAQWEKQLSIGNSTNRVATAESVRDALGLLGWPLPWKMSEPATNQLHFDMEQPGKSYTIKMDFSSGKAEVTERAKGFWPIVNSLHALTEVPNSKPASGWGLFTELCTWTVLFASLSGIYMWISAERPKLRASLFFGAALLLSLGFMAFVRYVG